MPVIRIDGMVGIEREEVMCRCKGMFSCPKCGETYYERLEPQPNNCCFCGYIGPLVTNDKHRCSLEKEINK